MTAAISRALDAFGEQACGGQRQPRPGRAEFRHVVGLVDAVAEDGGFLRAQAQQIARSDHAADLALLVFDREWRSLSRLMRPSAR